MQFQTQFNLNDTAWYMLKNKPTEVVISAIHIFYVNTSQDTIKYSARSATNSANWLGHTNLFEGILFKSKAELLESL